MRSARSGSNFFLRHIEQATGFGKIKLTVKTWTCHDERSAKAFANRVNNNFVDAIDNLTQKLNINCNSVCVETSSDRIKFNLLTTSDVRHINDSIKNMPTVDSDFVSPQMLFKSPVSVIKALTIIFNASKTIGVFLIAWKHSSVTPVFKKRDLYDPGNYRQISLLSIISKILERLINKQLRTFLDSNSVISAAQHGFRHEYSCETALMSLSKHLFHLRDLIRFVRCTAIYFSRAFDTVYQDILMSRIENICEVNTGAWYQFYLLIIHYSISLIEACFNQ